MKVILCIYLMMNVKMIYSQNRVFLKVTDLADTIPGKSIKKIKMPFGRFGQNILVINMDDTKSHLRKKSIWGYEKSNKEIIRFYQGDTFELVDTNAIIIYKTWARVPVYYFSVKLDNDVKLFSKKRLVKQLGQDRFAQVYNKSPIVQKLSQYY